MTTETAIVKAEYASLATAKRGAKRKGLSNVEFLPLKDGRVEMRNMDSPLYSAALRERSTVEGAVGVVWDIAAEMFAQSKTRKEILSECVAAGVNINTARTQYQAWRAASGHVKSRA